MYASRIDEASLKQLRECLQTGTPFGNDRFREQIEHTLGLKVGFSKRGRPKKPSEVEDKRDQSPDGSG